MKNIILNMLLCTCLSLELVSQSCYSMEVAFKPETLDNLGKVIEKIPTTATVVVRPELPSAHTLYAFIGTVSALAGIHLMYSGITILTDPTQDVSTCTCQQNQETLQSSSHTKATLKNKNNGIVRCSTGLAMLACGVMAIYKFGNK